MTRLRPQVYRGFWMQQLTYGPLNGLAMMFYNMAKEYLPDASKGTGKNGRATTRMARLRQPLPTSAPAPLSGRLPLPHRPPYCA
jgi:hypothetical protein